VKDMVSGTALGIVMVALLGAGGGVGLYASQNGGMGGAMSGNHMAQCGSMNAECGRDHASCAERMRAGTHEECEAMQMTSEECQTMHDEMSGDMMAGSCH